MLFICISSFFGKPQKFPKASCSDHVRKFSHYVKQDTQVKYCQIHKIQKKGLGFVSLATLDLYKEASEKRGVDQGCLRCTTEVTNQG